jgi:hypothetical protein
MKTLACQLLFLAVATIGGAPVSTAATLVDFESTSESFNANGTNTGPFSDNVSSRPSGYGTTIISSTFDVDGVTFNNSFDSTYQSFTGFALSRRPLTEFSFGSSAEYLNGNDTISQSGAGADGSATWAVAYVDTSASDEVVIEAPTNSFIDSLSINNTATTARLIEFGNFDGTFGVQPFGSRAQDELFTVRFVDSSPGATGLEFVEVELASYDLASNTLSVLRDFTSIDLTALGTPTRIAIDFTSTDTGAFGINTPTYVAIDNVSLTSTSVPEPSSLAFIFGCGLLVSTTRRRRK